MEQQQTQPTTTVKKIDKEALAIVKQAKEKAVKTNQIVTKNEGNN
jgi:hypothetical protein